MFKGASNAKTVREINRTVILELIRRRGPVSRISIARICNLNPSTVTNIVADLIADQLVQEVGPEITGSGRRPISLELDTSHHNAIGLELGDTKIIGVVIDLAGKVLERVKLPLERLTDKKQAIESATDILRQLSELQRERHKGRLIGVGVGVAGLVDREKGVSVFSPNLGWRDLPLGEHFRHCLQLPIHLDNDVKAMALGELWFGSGREAADIVCINVGAGLGSGVIIGGRIHRGANGSAGEIGHCVMDLDGPLCRCGSRGCAESLVGGNALLREAMEITRLGLPTRLADAEGKSSINLEQIAEAARQGDENALAMVRKTGNYLGIAIANAVNTFDPQKVILGGGLILGLPEVFEIARQTAPKYVYADSAKGTEISLTSLGENAQAIGAATLAIEALFNPLGIPLAREIMQHDEQADGDNVSSAEVPG